MAVINLGFWKCWCNFREFFIFTFLFFSYAKFVTASTVLELFNFTVQVVVSRCAFCKIRRNLGFFYSVNPLGLDLLGNTCLLARAQKVLVCDSWLVAFDPFCLFRVSRALLCDRPVSGNNRLVKFASQIFWSFLFLSLARIKQRLPPSFDKNSAHHRNLPWFFVSLFVGSLESFSANASWASKWHFDLH